MEIRLNKEEECKIIYNDCPSCHKAFNSRSRKRTEHHVIPKFLKPETEIVVTICKECHEKLNKHYNNDVILDTFTRDKRGLKSKPESYDEFLTNYKKLRSDYHAKKLDRGKFGEGLWTNLVNFLESLSIKCDINVGGGE